MNTILTILKWIIDTFILRLLPNEISFFPLLDFQQALINIRDLVSGSLGFLHQFVSVRLLFGFILTIIFAELSLLIFKSGKWLIQLVRGSG